MSSPPPHRHDGRSPLPLGMDVSPPPAVWKGPHTVWPHDPRGGWSFCVMLHSFLTLPTSAALPQGGKSGKSGKSMGGGGPDPNATVYYRLRVGIQTPQAQSTLHALLRRFSDFIKLHSALQRAFPRTRLPFPPPKNSLLKLDETMLHHRRRALSDWLAALLGDLSLARSAPMAAFLDLEGAALAAVRAADCQAALDLSPTETVTAGISTRIPSEGGLSDSSLTSATNFREASPRPPAMGIFEPLATAPTLGGRDGGREESEGEGEAEEEGREGEGEGEGEAGTGRGLDGVGEWEVGRVSTGRVLSAAVSSAGSVDGEGWGRGRGRVGEDGGGGGGSPLSSVVGSEGVGGNSSPLRGGVISSGELDGIGLMLPEDQRAGMKRVLAGLQRRLSTGAADMEDLITRLRQESAVKEFLGRKVREVEGELDAERRGGGEALRRAAVQGREAINELKWEVEEAKEGRVAAEERAEREEAARIKADDGLRRMQGEEGSLRKRVQEVEAQLEEAKQETEVAVSQARAEKKVLVKEVKHLRKVVSDAEEEGRAARAAGKEFEEKLQAQTRWASEVQRDSASWLHEVAVLRQRVSECAVDRLAEEEERGSRLHGGGGGETPKEDVMDLLEVSDRRLGMLVAEVQLLAHEQERKGALPRKGGKPNGVHDSGNDGDGSVEESEEIQMRKTMADLIKDTAQLRKGINSLTRHALVTAILEVPKLL